MNIMKESELKELTRVYSCFATRRMKNLGNLDSVPFCYPVVFMIPLSLAFLQEEHNVGLRRDKFSKGSTRPFFPIF